MYEIIADIVKRAGSIILGAHHIDEGVKEKSSACDLVTVYDTAVQAKLHSELLATFPEFGFYGEENDCCETEGKRGWFIVDPIDGTANFIRRLHHSCISVGLLIEGDMQYGVVYNPYYDELFTAERGKGAFLNGTPIHVSDVGVSDSLLLFGSAVYYRETIPATMRFVQELFPQTLDFRRGGSAALDLCYLAAGRADLYFECCIRPWDYAAGSLIAQEAGAIVTALDGTPLRFTDRCSVAAGNPKNYPELIRLSNRIAAEPDMKGRIQ